MQVGAADPRLVNTDEYIVDSAGGSGASCRVRPRAEWALTRAFIEAVCNYRASIYKITFRYTASIQGPFAEYAWSGEAAARREHARFTIRNTAANCRARWSSK
jgi:hypothetical protein